MKKRKSNARSAATNLRLDWCKFAAAKKACKNWHYSGSMPVGPKLMIGVWEDGVFTGCVIFARGGQPHMGKRYGLGMMEWCELSRVALRKHNTPVTRILAISMRMIKKHSPGLRLIISFADPQQGHHGGIYQGGNWLYSGATKQRRVFTKNGKRIHERRVTASGFITEFGKRRVKVLTPDECDITSSLPKYRYLYPLDAEIQERIEPMRKPYPNPISAGSIEGDAPSFQLGEGGSSPTPALQPKKRKKRIRRAK